MNTEKVDAAIVVKALEEQATGLLRSLKRIDSISSQEEYDRAHKYISSLKELKKIAKDKEQSLTTPLNEVIAKIRGLFKPFSSMVDETELRIKSLMLDFIQSQQEAAKQLERDFEKGAIKRVSTYARKSAELDTKKTGHRRVWRAICRDISKTPAKYLVPDEKAIAEALKRGEKVAGWVWEQVDQIAI